ncbi:MAG TPA: TetR/AcrR family transcriptional regulator [Ktedonobacterales bacterium]|nr:TetR/AcrR family transcriptional regulator [Ktedonobacterales bacterium]
MSSENSAGRTNQKTRTRLAIIDACRDLIRSGAAFSIPEVAQRALVSEATVYRYFPDLASLVNTSLAGLWPSPAEALAPVANSTDPVERIAFATEVFLRRVLAYQGSVRAMIAATITRPEAAATRPGLRFAWIAEALAPAEATLAPEDAEAFTRLKRDLAVVVSPEALFTLTDLSGLPAEEAITQCVHLASTITAAALKRTAT